MANFIANVYNQSPGFVFLPSDFNYYVGHCYLKCEPGETADIKKMIEKTLKETLPESIHPHVTTLQEDIYEAQAIENKLKGIILFFFYRQPAHYFVGSLFDHHIGYGTQTKWKWQSVK